MAGGYRGDPAVSSWDWDGRGESARRRRTPRAPTVPGRPSRRSGDACGERVKWKQLAAAAAGTHAAAA
jgi:hypothetical protein